MVDHPRAYRWSSYRGACRRRRRRAAQRACDLSCARARRRGASQGLSRAVPLRARRRIRRGARGGNQWRRALGDTRFARQIADAVGRRAAKLAPGRPSKDRPDERRQFPILSITPCHVAQLRREGRRAPPASAATVTMTVLTETGASGCATVHRCAAAARSSRAMTTAIKTRLGLTQAQAASSAAIHPFMPPPARVSPFR
jgi:hypothetical protein